MISLIKHCKLILTDSGGLQKEAFFFDKFCITLREETEWTELVENGYNFICGTSKFKINTTFNSLLNQKFPLKLNLYGNGLASTLIVNELLQEFN